MLHSLILFLMGIGFLVENFGFINGDQPSIFRIAETNNNSQNSSESKHGNQSKQFFNDQQRSIRNSVPNPVSQFPFESQNSSVRPTLRDLEKIDTKTSMKKLRKTQTSESSNINDNSMSTSLYGQYMRLSLNRVSQQPNRSRPSIRKLRSMENIDMVNTERLPNRSIHDGSLRMASIVTPAGMIVKNVTRRQSGRQESSTKENSGEKMSAEKDGEQKVNVEQNGGHEICAGRNSRQENNVEQNDSQGMKGSDTSKMTSIATLPGTIIKNVSIRESGRQEINNKENSGQEINDEQNDGREINDQQNYDQEINTEQNYGQEINDKQNYGQEMSSEQIYGQEINDKQTDSQKINDEQNYGKRMIAKENYGQEINTEQSDSPVLSSFETPKKTSIPTLPGVIINNLSRRQSGIQEISNKDNSGQEMSAEQNDGQEINTEQNDGQVINTEQNYRQEMSAQQNGGLEMSVEENDGQEINTEQNEGPLISVEQNGDQGMSSSERPKMTSIATLTGKIIKNVSGRESGRQAISNKEIGGQEMSAEQNYDKEINDEQNDRQEIINEQNYGQRMSTEENGGPEMGAEENYDKEINDEQNYGQRMTTEENSGPEMGSEEIYGQGINTEQNDGQVLSSFKTPKMTSIPTLPGTKIKNVSRRQSVRQEINDEQNYDQEINDEQNYGQEINDQQNYGQEINDKQNYDQEINDEQNYGQEINDEQNYDQEINDKQNYDQEINDKQNYGQEINDEQNYGQIMSSEQKHGPEMSSLEITKMTSIPTSLGAIIKNVSRRESGKQEISNNENGGQEINTETEQNDGQQMNAEQNAGQKIISERNGYQEMRAEQNDSQEMSAEQNGDQEMSAEQNDGQEMKAEQNDGQEMKAEQNDGQEIITEQNGDQEMRVEQNDGQEIITEQNGDQEMRAEQNDGQEIITEQNGDQEMRAEQNDGQEIITEQNSDQEMRAEQNDGQEIISEQNVDQEMRAEQDGGQEIRVGQNDSQEISAGQNRDQNIETEKNGGQAMSVEQNSLISRILRPLRAQLLNETNTLVKQNESDTKTEEAPSILVTLIDYIVSFMKLSYNVVGALLMNKTDLKTDLTSEYKKGPSGSSEIPIMEGIFARHVSNRVMARGNVAYQNMDQSRGRERIVLINQIGDGLNGTNTSSLKDGGNARRTRDFKTLIIMARSDSKYIKEWKDTVRAFLSKQSHQFMDNGIYTKLSSFWPRSARTAGSWILRLSGYCSQIEIDENTTAVDSPPLFCPFKIPECDKSIKYRNLTGVCNNLENPLWGSANVPYKRQLKNAYDDGVSKPRSVGKDGVSLPNARLISKTVFDYNDGKSNELINLFTVFFGQFVSHDITRFAMDIGDIGPVKVNCCLTETVNRSQCYPIFVKEEGQESTANGSVRCLHFLRSMPTVPLGCKSHVREQINQVTSFVDASNIYGSSFEEVNELRLFQRGLMKITLCGSDSLPPIDRKGASECGINADQRQFPCFYAGDPRVNENPGLALMHVLWLREHNRIAQSLGTINLHWNDTRLYEETRKIVGALMQHVVYNELIPLILGFDKAKEFRLLSGFKFFKEYEPNTDPTLENGVAAAAFRFGHGMVADRFLFMAGCPSAHSKCSPESISNGPNDQNAHLVPNTLIAPPMCPYMTQKNLSALFENVDVFHQSETELESLLRGLLMRSAEVTTDTMLTSALTEKLFGHMDLMARNVQRGRDHGLPAYNEWRKWCGLPAARNFHSNKTGFVDHEMKVVERLAQVYSHPDDVDLVIGGLTETPIEGALLGPTFVCILGRQFRQLKFGDRFWYESEGQFTEDQLREIRKIKMSHIILNNSGIESVPQFAFYRGSNENPFITSVDQVQLELSFWKEDENRKK